ncbi:potassium channel subfamily K member 1-like isoform X1 [Phlebotomus argentipes]|uniref:potassium channel subfamily K member 1-like isoform X1 n=1 Tax=Phlebotomus argentipes TaxID=94469 RepID=UPI002892BE24|nr:potassium channel subfamily K member 1-like isoform X1 [Phlebotomus argentipes]
MEKAKVKKHPGDELHGLLSDFADEFEARVDEIRLKQSELDFKRELHYEGIHYKKFTKRNHAYLIAFAIFYTFFLVLGALSFMSVESSLELETRRKLSLSRNTFRAKYSIQDDDLEAFLKEVVSASERGISILRNASSSELNWSFGQALFFSSTVVTTIGYGHVTPLSETGKIFCMIYATLGIPLTLVLLSAVVDRLMIPVSSLLGFMNAKLGHLYQPFNIRLLHLLLIVVVIGLLFLVAPMFVFAYMEPGWDLLDAFYYCFISLTTIGLGDFIPGDGENVANPTLYKTLTTCYLLLGLSGVMLALSVFYQIPQLNLGQLFTEYGSGASESEKMRLSGAGAPCYSGPTGLYIPQRDEEVRRAVVRIRPRGEDSPSPEDTTPMHARDIRVP